MFTRIHFLPIFLLFTVSFFSTASYSQQFFNNASDSSQQEVSKEELLALLAGQGGGQMAAPPPPPDIEYSCEKDGYEMLFVFDQKECAVGVDTNEIVVSFDGKQIIESPLDCDRELGMVGAPVFIFQDSAGNVSLEFMPPDRRTIGFVDRNFELSVAGVEDTIEFDIRRDCKARIF